MLAAVDQILKLAAQHSDYCSHWDDGQFLISWDSSKPAWFAPDNGEPTRLERSAEVGIFVGLADGNILGIDQGWQCYRQEFLAAGWRRPLTPQPMGIWNAASGARQRDLIGHHTGAVIGAELLDEQRLLTWGRDYLIRVWNYQSGDCLDVLPLPLWASRDDQEAILSSNRFSSLSRLEKIQYVEQRHLLAPNVQVDWMVAPGQKQHSYRCNSDHTSGEM